MSRKKKLPPGVRERDGRYTYRYTITIREDGKKRRKWKESPAYPTAQAAYDASILAKADRMRGKVGDTKKISVKDWRDRWIVDYESERAATPNTIYDRTNGTNSFIKYVGEDTLLRDVTVDDYQGWLNKLKREGKKKGTLRQYHQAVKIMFEDAHRRGVITSNPSENVIVPVYKPTLEEIAKGEHDIPQYCEKDELKKLLNVIRFQDEQDYRIAVILAYTGMRINELAALELTDFSEDDMEISITKNLTAKGRLKDFHLGPPKTTSSIRRITVGKTVVRVLKEQFAWRAQKILNQETVYDGSFIFWSMKFPGLPTSAVSYENRFKRYVAAAGLPNSITPHSLRHTHVSLLAEAGEQLSVIQERLGHKNDRTTESIYLHVTRGQKKLTPDRFEKIMGV